MKKTHFFLNFAVLLTLGAPVAALAGDAETRLFQRLALKEQVFFGIDADVRRLLNDPTFEADVRRWFLALNPAYVENVSQQGNDPYDKRPNPEAGELKAWAAKNKLKQSNDRHLRLRQLVAATVEPGLPSEKAGIYLAYFLRTDQAAKARSLLRIYALEYALWAGEYGEDPRHRGSRNASAALSLVAKILKGSTVEDYAACAGSYTGNVESIREVGSCLQKSIQFFLPPGYAGPEHVVSRTGYVDGNEVAYFTDNRHDRQILSQWETLYRGNSNPVADLIGNKSVDQLAALFKQNASPFSALPIMGVPGNPALDTGPALNAQSAIFPELVRGIRSAKHTIFVDIFFLGGTLGATMTSELIAASERGVKVMLLHDNFNAFNYTNEIAPVFKAAMAYGSLHRDRFVVASSYIMGHRTGLPRFMDAILPDKVVENILAAAKTSTGLTVPLFPKAKSDHSKVMVVDGAGFWADSTPTAYVGSKNWTDSSGAITFDEVARVKGPAAVVVQDNYYWDMWYALRNGSGIRKPMEGAQIEAALAPFDALGRRWVPGSDRVQISGKGLANVGAVANGITVRVGENNVDGSIMSALDQNVYAIRAARRQIVINDQFLYDRRLVEELIDKARSNPQVQIYILLEPISKTSGLELETLAGFPNNLYLDQLLYQSFELDARGLPQFGKQWPNIHFRWKKIPESPEFHMEYHMKTISVDGFDAGGKRVVDGPAVLISGSANKDCMTMTGAFRESQLELWDPRPCTAQGCGAVAEADRVFWKRWKNLATLDEGLGSEALLPSPQGGGPDPYRFTLPPQIQSVAQHALGRDMTSAEFVLFMRSLVHSAYGLERGTTVE